MANPNPYVASQLLASARRKGQIPESSDRSFSETDLLELMSEELQTYVVPLLMSVREEWMVKAYDVEIGSGTSYRIPVRSVGSKLRQVLVSNGNATNSGANQWVVLQRIEPIDQYQNYFGNSWNPGSVQGYYLENTDLRLLANPPQGSTLRMMYFLRPNRIVAQDACGTITAINTGLNQITIDPEAMPLGDDDAFGTQFTYDLVRGTPGFETLAMDQTVTAVSGADDNVFTFADTLPSGLAVGDFMCLAGEAPVAQIPVEMQPLLTQALVVKVLEALGDPKVAVAQSKLDLQKKLAVDILTSNRTEGDPRFVINTTGPGWGRKRWGW